MKKSAEELADEVSKLFRMRPRRHGREWRVPCPVHEAEGHHNPSMAIWEGPSGVFFKCMTGCPQEAVRKALRGHGVSIPGRTIMSTREQLEAARASEAARIDGLRRAFDALSDADPVTPDDPVGRYLASRYLTAPPGLRSVFCGGDPVVSGGRSMLAPIIDLSTATSDAPTVLGVTSLSLRPDGTPLQIGSKKLRSVIGQPKGNGVALGEPTRTIIAGEGIETVLAARVLIAPFFGVATLSASNLPFLAPPEWVEEVIIAQDNDDAGRVAAEALRKDLEGIGVRVSIETFSGPRGYDAADVLRDMRERK